MKKLRKQLCQKQVELKLVEEEVKKAKYMRKQLDRHLMVFRTVNLIKTNAEHRELYVSFLLNEIPYRTIKDTKCKKYGDAEIVVKHTLDFKEDPYESLYKRDLRTIRIEKQRYRYLMHSILSDFKTIKSHLDKVTTKYLNKVKRLNKIKKEIEDIKEELNELSRKTI